MATLQHLFLRNIYANVKLHFYNRQNMSYELFYKKLFIWSYYRRKSQHLWVVFFFSCPWAVPLSFSCFFTLFSLSIFYKSSLTSAFFMCFDTRIWVLSLVLLFLTALTAFDAEFGTYGFRWYLVGMYCALSGAQIL